MRPGAEAPAKVLHCLYPSTSGKEDGLSELHKPRLSNGPK